MEITDAYGASACEKAMRIQENPPNGKCDLNSSSNKIAGINQRMFRVNLPRKPSGRRKSPCKSARKKSGRRPTYFPAHNNVIALPTKPKIKESR